MVHKCQCKFPVSVLSHYTQRTVNGVLTTNQGCYPLRLPLPERKGRSPRYGNKRFRAFSTYAVWSEQRRWYISHSHVTIVPNYYHVLTISIDDQTKTVIVVYIYRKIHGLNHIYKIKIKINKKRDLYTQKKGQKKFFQDTNEVVLFVSSFCTLIYWKKISPFRFFYKNFSSLLSRRISLNIVRRFNEKQHYWGASNLHCFHSSIVLKAYTKHVTTIQSE